MYYFDKMTLQIGNNMSVNLLFPNGIKEVISKNYDIIIRLSASFKSMLWKISGLFQKYISIFYQKILLPILPFAIVCNISPV